MIFHHGFYHADPHPGNLMVLPDGTIGLVDFGMVARLDESLREDIEDMLAAIVSQDAQQLTALVTRLGAVPPGLDEAALSIDLTEFVVHYANQPVDTFDLGGALTEMIEIIQRYRIALPSAMAMLIKVLVMLEGTGRLLGAQLQPDGAGPAVPEKDDDAAAVAGPADAQAAPHLLRGGAARRNPAAAAPRDSAASRNRQVRRPSRSPRPGTVGQPARAGHDDQRAVPRLVAADQHGRVGHSRRLGARHAWRAAQRISRLAAAAGDQQIGPPRPAEVMRFPRAAQSMDMTISSRTFNRRDALAAIGATAARRSCCPENRAQRKSLAHRGKPIS